MTVDEAQTIVDRGDLERGKLKLALVGPGQTSTQALYERYEAELALTAHGLYGAQSERASANLSSAYSRTCTVNFGSGNTQPWNSQKAVNCAGTVKYYYHGTYYGFINMVQCLAQQGNNPLSTMYNRLNSYCNSHSLVCGAGFLVVGYVVSSVFG